MQVADTRKQLVGAIHKTHTHARTHTHTHICAYTSKHAQ